MDPENPPDGYYFVQAIVWRDAYHRLSEELKSFHSLNTVYSRKCDEILKKYEEANAANLA